MNCGVYAIRNIANEKCYVGSTGKLSLRWGQHRYELMRGTHFNPYLQHAWDKYGASSFVYDILEHCSNEMLLIREEHWIKKIKSFKEDNGYNLCKTPRASRLGCKASAETIQKMKHSLSGNRHPMWGKSLKESTKQKISDVQRGVKKPTSGARKTFTLFDPTGKAVEVIGLRNFCRENKLPLSIMWRVVNGKKANYAGWSLNESGFPKGGHRKG